MMLLFLMHFYIIHCVCLCKWFGTNQQQQLVMNLYFCPMLLVFCWSKTRSIILIITVFPGLTVLFCAPFYSSATFIDSHKCPHWQQLPWPTSVWPQHWAADLIVVWPPPSDLRPADSKWRGQSLIMTAGLISWKEGIMALSRIIMME